MTTNYQISPQTIQSIARLRELHVARAQAVELKEFGRIVTKSDEADSAAVEFRNGSVQVIPLPVKIINRWAQLLTGGTMNLTIESGAVLFSNGGSQARFLVPNNTAAPERTIVVDAGTGHEFKLVGATADETELAKIKTVLAAVRKSAKQENELRLAREKRNESFRNLRAAADRVTAARVYLTENSLDLAILSAKSLRDAHRLARKWTTNLKHYNPETPAGLPLSAEDKAILAKCAADYVKADKKGHYVKKFKSAMVATNILVDAVAELVKTEFPVVTEHLHIYRVHEKFPGRPAQVGIYNYDLQVYSTHRRYLREWTAVRTELAVPYKLALARLAKAQGK